MCLTCVSFRTDQNISFYDCLWTREINPNEKEALISTTYYRIIYFIFKLACKYNKSNKPLRSFEQQIVDVQYIKMYESNQMICQMEVYCHKQTNKKHTLIYIEN